MPPSSPAQLLLYFSRLWLVSLQSPAVCEFMSVHSSRLLKAESPLWFQVFGFLTRPLISVMLPHRSRVLSRGHSTASNSPKDDFTLPFLSADEGASGSGIVLEHAKRSLSLLLERPVHTVHIYWRKFDDKFMRPIFGGPQLHWLHMRNRAGSACHFITGVLTSCAERRAASMVATAYLLPV